MKAKLNIVPAKALELLKRYNPFGIIGFSACKRYANEKGVALLLILWVLFLLSVISAEFAFSMRTDFAVTLNFKEEMEAYYLAQAGVNKEIAKILHEQMVYNEKKKMETATEEELEEAFPPFESPELEGIINSRSEDERAKININSVPNDVLRCLLEKAAGITDESTQNTIIDSIDDWKDNDDLFRPAGAEDDYYQDLSPPYHCKNGPFDTVEELLLIQGITREILFGGKTSAESEKSYPGIGKYLTVWNDKKFNKDEAPSITLLCKLGEEAAAKLLQDKKEDAKIN